jgi:hypothetical protein
VPAGIELPAYRRELRILTDEGCRVAERAISIGESLDSVRCRGYVTEFRQRLARHRSTEQARDLVARVSTSRLWAAAGSGQ